MANRKGQKFNRLTIIDQDKLACTALCDCGTYIVTTTYNVTSGRTASCGCLRRETVTAKNTTHGLTNTPTWYSWVAMKRRCNDTTMANASSYSLKGITYDPKWESFENFLFDMGERPEGTTLDRKENGKGYYKENCRWATSREQWLNRDDPRIAVHLAKLKCDPSTATSAPSTTNSSPAPSQPKQ